MANVNLSVEQLRVEQGIYATLRLVQGAPSDMRETLNVMRDQTDGEE